jgi:small-conductance mechanosensitive channel
LEYRLIESVWSWVQENAIQMAVTLLVVFVYAVVDRMSTPRLEESIQRGGFKDDSLGRAKYMARIITGLVGATLLVFIWGIELGSLLVVAGTALTLLGVAFFAQWSLLSNVTCYFVLLLHPSYGRGTFVRVIDGDNYAEGYIADVTLFSVRLITENRESIVYPNNLMLGRPTLINPRDRLDGVGKIAKKDPQPGSDLPEKSV